MFFWEYLFWAFFFLSFGLLGLLFESKSLIYLLCFIEVFYLGLNMLILLYVSLWQDYFGIIFSFFILSLTAIETAFALMLVWVTSKQLYSTSLGFIKFFY